METPEDFWQRLDREIEQGEDGGVYLGGHAAELIEARDDAVALVARAEVISELERVAESSRWNDDRNMLTGICKMLRAKFALETP